MYGELNKDEKFCLL